MSLQKLIDISNYYGNNPDYVLAGGGNTSYKDKDYLYIKGSGTTLAAITEDGFVKMNRAQLGEIWNKEYPKATDEREKAVLRDLMAARVCGEEHKRPSVETSLHDLIPNTYVVHLHPALVNGVTCGINGKECISEIITDFIWIDVIEPGYILAKKVKDEMESFKARKGFYPFVIVLQNHGIFVGADSVDEVKKIYDDIMNKLTSMLKEKPDFSSVEFDKERAVFLSPAIRMLVMEGDTSIVKFDNNKSISRLIADEASFKAVSSAYTPDHIVYCKPNPLFVPYFENIDEQYNSLQNKITEYKENFGYMPKIIAAEKTGVFFCGSTKKAADTVRMLFLDTVKISVYSKSFGGNLFMPQKYIDFIVNWEVESYRSKTSSAQNKARIAEKIMIVTGSAQGFGFGIVEEMLAEGGNVVIADLNYDLAMQNKNILAEKYCGSVMATRVDVTNEQSTIDMIYDTVLEFGGLDTYVNNAGIVKAGSLEEMSVANMELTAKVNYIAYFLGAKYASRIMKIQNRFKQDYYTDIIQVNSKSGLSGSNKNFAYAGSKFGGIGLTQSFALELVPYNIKVNSVCPGNFLDGPLWCDPEKGLFKQYLEAGKVPGAKTVADVKKFYESKVPMNRGCLVIDVARAIFYCMEQQYETGQAIPVTGGQNMLK